VICRLIAALFLLCLVQGYQHQFIYVSLIIAVFRFLFLSCFDDDVEFPISDPDLQPVQDPEKRISAWSLVKEIGHSGGKRRIDGHIFVFFSSGGKPCSVRLLIYLSDDVFTPDSCIRSCTYPDDVPPAQRRREWNFWIEISGDEKIETLAYAHYREALKSIRVMNIF